MSSVIRRKVSLGVVIGSRAFFSPAPCKAARDDVLAQLARLGVEAVILPFEATANGRSSPSPTPIFTPAISARMPRGLTGW